MNKIVEQYISLWKENKEHFSYYGEIIDSHREDAAKILEEKGLPKYKSEDYQRTDIESVVADDWGVDIRDIDASLRLGTSQGCDLGDQTLSHAVAVNNRILKDKNKFIDIPEEVFIGNFRDFSEKYPEQAKKYYASIADSKKNTFVALANLLTTELMVFYIPKNVSVEHPLQLLNLINGNVKQMHLRRMLIIAEENSKFMLLSCESLTRNLDTFILDTIEIFVGKGAELSIVTLEETASESKKLANIYADIHEEAKLSYNGLTLSNGLTRNNYYINLLGEKADAILSGLAIGTGKEHIDNYSFINHAVPNCTADELFKYVLTDESHGVFTGKIYVAKDAQKTAAYQTNRNLLLSKKCRMQAKPQLEIYADDVRCSHGMTTGQLDENALFYMRQRGIGEEEAKLMLSIAFTEDVIATIPLESLQDRVREIVDSRFRNNETKVCGSNCHCGCSCGE